MVKHHVGGDLVVLLALRLTIGSDAGIKQAGGNVNRVGVGTGQHLIQAVNQALALVARLGVLAVNVHVARNLPVFVADVLQPGTDVVLIHRPDITRRHMLAVHFRMAQRHWVTLKRVVSLFDFCCRVQLPVHHDIVHDRRDAANHDMWLAVDGFSGDV